MAERDDGDTQDGRDGRRGARKGGRKGGHPEGHPGTASGGAGDSLFDLPLTPEPKPATGGGRSADPSPDRPRQEETPSDRSPRAPAPATADEAPPSSPGGGGRSGGGRDELPLFARPEPPTMEWEEPARQGGGSAPDLDPGDDEPDEDFQDSWLEEPWEDEGSTAAVHGRTAPISDPAAETVVPPVDTPEIPPASRDLPDGAVAGGRLQPRPAPLGHRFAAALLDGGLLLVVSATAIVGAYLLGVRWDVEDLPALTLFLLVFSFAYSVVPLAFWGRTPGMALTGIVARGSDGGPLTFGQTAVRWLGGLVTLVLAGLPLLLALAPFGSRSLADRLSGSRTWLPL